MDLITLMFQSIRGLPILTKIKRILQMCHVSCSHSPQFTWSHGGTAFRPHVKMKKGALYGNSGS